MNGKQQYYGNIKKRSNEQRNDTLAKLYRESEYANESSSKPKKAKTASRSDIDDFLSDASDISEEKLKEKRSAKKRRERNEKKAAAKASAAKVFKRIAIVLVIIAIIGGGVFLFLKTGASSTELDALETAEAKPDEIYYSRLTGKEVTNAETTTAATTCIMIENSPSARPQSGLNEAGVIYEAIAEGGITRFLAIFQEAKPSYVGPVRSVRLTFAELAKPYHCSIAHVGGSDNALNLIRNNSEFRDIDQFFNDKYYWRIRSRAAPHNVYTRFSMLDELNFNKGYRTSEYNGFARVKPDTTPIAPETVASTINIPMGSATYSPTYTYNAETNKYLRSYAQGGEHYSISEDGTKIRNAPDVVVAMKVTSIARSSEAAYADYVTTGTGDAYIFQNGGVTSGRWTRDNVNSELRFTDTSGNDIQLNRGQTWITLYPSNNNVTWQ